MLRNFLSFLYTEFFYNGHLQCLGAVSIVITAAIIFGFKLHILPLVTLYISFYTFFLYNRYKELKTDIQTNPVRSEHFLKLLSHVKPLIYSLSFLILVLLAVTGNTYFILLNLLIITLGFLYTDYFKGLTKYVYFFKNFYVALVFAALVYYLPVFSNTHIIQELHLLALSVLIHAIFMQLVLDLKDITSDSENKFLTLGALIGLEKSVYTLSFLNILIAAGTYFLFQQFAVQYLILSFVLVLFIVHQLNLFFVYKKKILGYIIESGLFVLWPFLLFLGKIISS